MEHIRRLVIMLLLTLRLKTTGPVSFNPNDPMIEINKIVAKNVNRYKQKQKQKQNIFKRIELIRERRLHMIAKPDYPGWIAGFTDGEGCFSVSFTQREKSNVGVEVRPSFAIGQKAASRESLEKIQKYFDCGGIRYSKKDGLFKYEVRNLTDLVDKIIPFFEKYQLETTKKNDFKNFAEVCKSMKQGHHLNAKGVEEIIDKSFKMNESGKRKYTSEELKLRIKNKSKEN